MILNEKSIPRMQGKSLEVQIKSHNDWSRLSSVYNPVGCCACQITASQRLHEVPKERLGDLVPFQHQCPPQISDRLERGSSVDAPLKLVPCMFNRRHVGAEGRPEEQGNVVHPKNKKNLYQSAV